MIISTTSSLEGYEIQAYLGPVSAHVVAGTGLFSDIAASFSDIFGGRSQSYQKQLAAIQREVLSALKDEAWSLGGNGIIGLSVDHDEISGGGKSMLMVTAMGTAVRQSRMRTDDLSEHRPAVFRGDDVLVQWRMRNLRTHLEKGRPITSDQDWTFLIENRIGALATQVADAISDGIHEAHARRYFFSIPPEDAWRALFSMILGEDSYARFFATDVIKSRHLVRFRDLIKVLEEGTPDQVRAIMPLFTCEQQSYGMDDIAALEKIESLLSGIREQAQRYQKKRTFSSKDREVWKCGCGYENEVDQRHCGQCMRDPYGYKAGSVNPKEARSYVQTRISVLREMMGAT